LSGTLLDLGSECSTLDGFVFSGYGGTSLDVELGDSGGDDGGGLEADHVVEVSNNVFTPDHLDIAAGETVEWINLGGFHNVDGSTETYPNNPDSFYSGSASSDSWTYSFTFEVAGNYDYECTPHADMGMVGTVTVGSGGCTDPDACHSDAAADFDDGSCTYAEENYDCDGSCTAGEDCAGECGGSAVEDECGECGGDGSTCAGGTVDFQLVFSQDGVCHGGDYVTYDSPTDIYGFQMDLVSYGGEYNINGANGGAAEESGYIGITVIEHISCICLAGRSIATTFTTFILYSRATTIPITIYINSTVTITVMVFFSILAATIIICSIGIIVTG
jgi:plastocyanin